MYKEHKLTWKIEREIPQKKLQNQKKLHYITLSYDMYK